MKKENKELCTKCGGKCCKQSGCEYFIKDFKRINKKNILKALSKGNISIVSTLFMNTNKNMLSVILHLRARNKDRNIIDLLSFKQECSMLTDTGCAYNIKDRPSGGVNLIPGNPCKPLLDHQKEILKWLQYQDILYEIVKELTGKSVEEKLKEDIEEVTYRILTKQYSDINPKEILEFANFLPELIPFFPEEFYMADIRATNYYSKKRAKNIN